MLWTVRTTLRELDGTEQHRMELRFIIAMDIWSTQERLLTDARVALTHHSIATFPLFLTHGALHTLHVCPRLAAASHRRPLSGQQTTRVLITQPRFLSVLIASPRPGMLRGQPVQEIIILLRQAPITTFSEERTIPGVVAADLRMKLRKII